MGFVVGGVLVVGGVTAASREPMGRHTDTGTAATLRERRVGIVIGVLGVVFMAQEGVRLGGIGAMAAQTPGRAGTSPAPVDSVSVQEQDRG